MRVQWPVEFDDWVRRLRDKARKGHGYSRRQLELVTEQTEQLKRLRSLSEPPSEETAGLRRVSQSGRYPVWRLSHRYEEGVAVRLVCWFPPDSDEVVVALFAGEKARIGGAWYDSVGHRADMVIEQWLREGARQADDED